MPNNQCTFTTKEQISQELISLYNQHGIINETIINQFSSFTRRPIRTHFGSISKACFELGLTQGVYNKPKSRKGISRKIWTKPEVISLIQELVSRHGYFSKGLIDLGGAEYGKINHKVITRIWGSFNNMYQELNIPQKPSLKGMKIIPDKEYETVIEEFIQENNITEMNSIVLQKICDKYFISNATIRERFGSIEELSKRFNIPYVHKWQSEEDALKFVATYLNDFNFIKQHKNKNIRSPFTNILLRIDGFWPNFNLCVEYNGEQHYKFVPYFHKTKENFNKLLEIDKFKYDKINSLGFKLLIIKHNDSKQDVIDKLNTLFEPIKATYTLV